MRDIGDVVCAIIENNNSFLIAQRPLGHSLENKWEFPGGKVLLGEDLRDAIRREIFEELNMVVEVHSQLTPNKHSYDHISLTLIPFRCFIISGSPQPIEHSQLAWVTKKSVEKYEFAEADIPILQEYLAQMKITNISDR